MSTGLNCEFVEVKTNTKSNWYYILENWDAPKMAWDWRKYATAYGPFTTQELAHAHLHDNHANPGGYTETSYTQDELNQDECLKNLLEHAKIPALRRWY